MIELVIGVGFGLALLFFLSGIRIIRPVELALVERFGKYKRTAEQGFNWIIPLIDEMIKVNITEQMVDIDPQMVITNDNLNARVDAVVYYKVKDVKKSVYNVDSHKGQLSSLARTTLRGVIGTMSLMDANQNRDKINNQVESILDKETDSYGVEVLRVEIQKIEPPKDVQIAMNQVVKAEQSKIAAADLALSQEIQADGFKKAEIKKAEGIKESKILAAQGEAQSIKLVNEAAEKYFRGNAQILRKLKTVENSLKNNSKVIVPSNAKLINVVGEMAGIVPVSED